MPEYDYESILAKRPAIETWPASYYDPSNQKNSSKVQDFLIFNFSQKMNQAFIFLLLS